MRTTQRRPIRLTPLGSFLLCLVTVIVFFGTVFALAAILTNVLGLPTDAEVAR